MKKNDHMPASVAQLPKSEEKLNQPGGFDVEMSLPPLLALTLLPWFLAVLWTATVSAGLHFLAYVGIASTIGYAILAAALPIDLRYKFFVLAPALGIVVIEAVSGVWLRLGLEVQWLPWAWILLGFAGLPLLWIDRHRLVLEKIPWAWTLVIVSALSCLIFFVPSAKNNSVAQRMAASNGFMSMHSTTIQLPLVLRAD